MGTLDLRFDAIKKQVSLSGIHRLDSAHNGLRAVAATVVIFYQDDNTHNLQGSKQANHENVPSSLSFLPAPEIVGREPQRKRVGALDGVPFRGSLQHHSRAVGVRGVSFNTRAADGEQDVSVEERMESVDGLAADTAEIHAAYMGYGAGSSGHLCDGAGYEDVEMTSTELHPPESNGEDAVMAPGLPLQIKEEPLSPDHISIVDDGEMLQPFPDGVQICEVRTLQNNAEKRSQDNSQVDGSARSTGVTGGSGYEVQELKQEDDSDLESLPLHFLTEQAPSCSVNLDLGESACGNPYESIMTDSVDLTELPETQTDTSSEVEPISVSCKETAVPILRSAESMQKLHEDTGGKKGGAESSLQDDCKVEESASLHCGEHTDGTEGMLTSTTPEADFTCETSEVLDSVRPLREQTILSNTSETQETLTLTDVDGEDHSASVRASQDITGAGCVSDPNASGQVQLIDISDIKKEPDPEDCCIVGVTPGRQQPPLPSANRGLGNLPGRGNVGNHVGRMQMSRRLPAMDRRSELFHRFGSMPPRVPSRMPVRVPSRAPSRQAMYYGYVVRRELQRHQMGTTAPRRRRQHSYTGGKYGTCAVCHADIFNYVDYLNHLNNHRNVLEDASSFSCPMCLKKSISYLEIANSHATSHVDKDLHTCPVCKSHIFRKDNFRRHFTLRHPNELPMLAKYLSQYKKLVTNCMQRQAVKNPAPGPAPPQGQAALGRQGDRNSGVGGPAMAFPQGFPPPVRSSPVQGDGVLTESQMANYVQRQLALTQTLAPPAQQPLGGRPRDSSGATEMHSPSSRPLAPPSGFPPLSHSLPTSFADIEVCYAQTSGVSMNQLTHPITHLVQSVLQHEASTSQVASLPCAPSIAFPGGQFPQPSAAMGRNVPQAPTSAQKGATSGEASTPNRSRIGKFANMCRFCLDPIPNKVEYGKHLDHHHQRGSDFVCPICGTTLSTRSCCLRHADSHTLPDADQSQCPECHKIFVRADNFKRHLRIVHNINSIPKRNIKIESP